MAATGGPPPPHRGFEDEPSNGNSPPGEGEMLHLTTSSTDAIFPSQPTLGRIHFLSAKNSVELHKQTIVRKNSLPASFRREDYDMLLARQAGSDPSTLFGPRGLTITSQLAKKSRPKTVAWADIHGQPLVRQSSEPETIRQTEQEQIIPCNGSRSVENMEVDSDITDGVSVIQEEKIDASMDPTNLSNTLSGLEETLNSFSLEDSTKVPGGTTDVPMVPIANHQLQPNMLPQSLIDMNSYGSFGSQENLNIRTATIDHLVNPYDGLANPMDIPRAVLSQESLNHYKGELTPMNEQYETCRDPPNNDHHDCAHPKTAVTAMDRDLNNYDDDDEFVMPEKPRLVMPTANDLATMTPDPAFCVQHYSPEYHSRISTVYKKDCRTWLWKSALQRSARLAQQEHEKKLQEQYEHLQGQIKTNSS